MTHHYNSRGRSIHQWGEGTGACPSYDSKGVLGFVLTGLFLFYFILGGGGGGGWGGGGLGWALIADTRLRLPVVN